MITPIETLLPTPVPADALYQAGVSAAPHEPTEPA
jgi:hypothetical protein